MILLLIILIIIIIIFIITIIIIVGLIIIIIIIIITGVGAWGKICLSFLDHKHDREGDATVPMVHSSRFCYTCK